MKDFLPLFLYFGYGTVFDFWHFSEKFLWRINIVSLADEELFKNLRETELNQKYIHASRNYTSPIEPDLFHIDIVVWVNHDPLHFMF